MERKKYGIPQGPIFGPIFSNVNLCDLFFIMKGLDIVSFADDNTQYMSANNVTNLVEDLEDSAGSIFNWFANNQMQGNATKCHVLLGTKRKRSILDVAAVLDLPLSKSEKLLGVTYDIQLCFEKHINNICSRAKATLGAFSRVAPFMIFSQKKMLINAFF